MLSLKGALSFCYTEKVYFKVLSCNIPEIDPNILWHCGIRGVADEAVLKQLLKRIKIPLLQYWVLKNRVLESNSKYRSFGGYSMNKTENVFLGSNAASNLSRWLLSTFAAASQAQCFGAKKPFSMTGTGEYQRLVLFCFVTMWNFWLCLTLSKMNLICAHQALCQLGGRRMSSVLC